jgi:hypothetical protein
MISAGDLGRNSDGAVLKTSPMYKVVNEGTNFPPPHPLPTEEDKRIFIIWCYYINIKSSISTDIP